MTTDHHAQLPLQGTYLIEASAGTGKTYALTTLFMRMVIERKLDVGEILVVTYTKAATQDMRQRIRERIETSIHSMEHNALDEDDDIDRQIIDYLATSDETPEHLLMRLRRALQQIDLAPINTIHQFCYSVLKQFPLETGEFARAPDIINTTTQLEKEVTAAIWRQLVVNVRADILMAVWNGPGELQKDMPTLLKADRIEPAYRQQQQWNDAHLQQAYADVLHGYDMQGKEIFDALNNAWHNDVFNKNRIRAGKFDEIERILKSKKPLLALKDEDINKLDILSASALPSYAKKGREASLPHFSWFTAIDAFIALYRDYQQWLVQERFNVLHMVHQQARQFYDKLKQRDQVMTYDDVITKVSNAVTRSQDLQLKLQQRYKTALVDEFQDTDYLQGRLFETLFGAATGNNSLYLIGDPKQAIYGFRGGDIDAYLQLTATAEKAPPLVYNYRSRPALVNALNQIYASAASDGFVDARIRYHSIEAKKRQDESLLYNGCVAAGLTIVELSSDSESREKLAEPSRHALTLACVSEIAWLLDAQNEVHIDGRAISPGDIAVLVYSHKDALRIRRALAAAGLPSITAGKHSIFKTVEAKEVLHLLQALLQLNHAGKLKYAFSTALVGWNADKLHRVDTEHAVKSEFYRQAVMWHEQWQHNGVYALVAQLTASRSAQLLAGLDGERRISNYLQLAEVLQEKDHAIGDRKKLVDWLRNSIHGDNNEDDELLLRLESEQDRIQIVTLHKSKGLEYPLVFIPYLELGSSSNTGKYVLKVENGEQVLYADAASASSRTHEEAMRLLYVGLTRAQHAVWVFKGDGLYGYSGSPLHTLIKNHDGHTKAVPFDSSANRVAPAEKPELHSTTYHPPRIIKRKFSNNWSVYSFTRITRSDQNLTPYLFAEMQTDEDDDDHGITSSEMIATNVLDIFKGSRFGNAVHTVLEHAAHMPWPATENEKLSETQREVMVTSLRNSGYTQEQISNGLPFMYDMINATLTEKLPEGISIAELDQAAMRSEMEFYFSITHGRKQELLALLSEFGVLKPGDHLQVQAIMTGLMTGKIDFIYQYDSAWYIVDYKTNLLSAYDQSSMLQEMEASHYLLQGTLYTLALHRWLRFKLGDSYSYAADFGGVRYLFLRGLLNKQHLHDGVYAWKPDAHLINRLDRLFD